MSLTTCLVLPHIMIHFTCDLCGKKLGAERYTVRVEVSAAFDPDQLTEADLDEDHLASIAAEIEALESTGDFSVVDTGSRLLNYDLCERCCQSYLKSPLPRLTAPRPKFSHN